MQSYAQAIIGIAHIFAERLACPDLMNRLVGTEESNPYCRMPKPFSTLSSRRSSANGLRM
jgi:hypothetical protein